MPILRNQLTLSAALLLASIGSIACGGDDGASDSVMDASTGPATGAVSDAGTAATAPAEFAVGTLVTAEQRSNGYLSFVPQVEQSGARIELGDAREFAGQSDFWVIGKSIWVASGDRPAITRYERDGNRMLQAQGAPVDFSMYGIESAALWNNVFVSATKAYMTNGPDELIVWNPTTMLIERTIQVPGLEPKNGLNPRASLADRSNMLVDGKIYRTVHWTDENYFHRAPDSLVVVIDTATDTVVEKISVPCAGLDYGTVTDDGKLFFSNWTGSVASALTLSTEPPTCFSQIDPKTNKVLSTRNFADMTGGYEGAALRYVGNGKFAFSSITVKSGAPETAGMTGTEVVAGQVFRFWLYDSATHQAAPIDGIAPNSGAIYEGKVKGQYWALVPGKDYADTSAYRIVDGKAIKGFDMKGWVLRLFGYPN